VSSPDPELLNRAAACYQRLGTLAEAARCYREAGSHRRAAELYERLGRFRDAALDYARADSPDLAAWLLAHHAGDPAGARAQLAAVPARSGNAAAALRRRLILARCEVAEGRRPKTALAALAAAQAELARRRAVPDSYLEPWSVWLAESMGRPDQVALVFAAAVRGQRFGAEQRWRAWMRAALHAELILPVPAVPVGR
jgi:hypothetical protein